MWCDVWCYLFSNSFIRFLYLSYSINCIHIITSSLHLIELFFFGSVFQLLILCFLFSFFHLKRYFSSFFRIRTLFNFNQLFFKISVKKNTQSMKNSCVWNSLSLNFGLKSFVEAESCKSYEKSYLCFYTFKITCESETGDRRKKTSIHCKQSTDQLGSFLWFRRLSIYWQSQISSWDSI